VQVVAAIDVGGARYRHGVMTMVIQAYRYALDPTAEQGAALRSHCGGQRFAFNWGLALVIANLAQREAERSSGQAGDRLTPAVWWSEKSKEAYADGLANLVAALGNWTDSRSGRRRGSKVRFPRFT
jgi:putative transposase